MTDTTDSELFDPAGIEWQPVSPRLATARFILLAVFVGGPLVVFAVLGAVLSTTWPWIVAGALAVLGVLVALVVGRQVRSIGYAERDEDLLVRKGVLFRSLVVVPYGRMQFVDVSAGPLARKLGIASVQLHTASPSTDANIDGLPPAEAARVRDRLASRGEARLAGL
ncbi:PH domain-containing protein [Sanguibacter suaedae]|uniref:PH domain-containing protein n=1 Tax=Sanguibacter suaedae TaxID=2795737 RepID=A0A934IAU4_9MICO|nr:PH domain-containing protein [Sanguibacter suaedae]MBI9116237.1 PH domain-containing protein [Sanguibacter suaedae]